MLKVIVGVKLSAWQNRVALYNYETICSNLQNYTCGDLMLIRDRHFATGLMGLQSSGKEWFTTLLCAITHEFCRRYFFFCLLYTSVSKGTIGRNLKCRILSMTRYYLCNRIQNVIDASEGNTKFRNFRKKSWNKARVSHAHPISTSKSVYAIW